VPVDIKSIQLRLKDLGYTPGNTEGVMDEQTANAIRHFQEDKSMVIDGKPSHELHDALYGQANSFDEYLKQTEKKKTQAQQKDGSPADNSAVQKSNFKDAFDNF